MIVYSKPYKQFVSIFKRFTVKCKMIVQKSEPCKRGLIEPSFTLFRERLERTRQKTPDKTVRLWNKSRTDLACV